MHLRYSGTWNLHFVK